MKINALSLILLLFIQAQTRLVADTWASAGTTNAPPAVLFTKSVWTGSEMIIWGGSTLSDGYPNEVTTNKGGRYNPSTKQWSSTTTVAAPSARLENGMVWTGSKVAVWGGRNGLNAFNDGALYNPATNNWTTISSTDAPTDRFAMTMVWTGTHVIVWGGRKSDGTDLSDGAKYNPSTDKWTSIKTSGAPTPRTDATAVWTGNKMVVWGGEGRRVRT